MIKFINRLTGTVMWVPDERKGEYEAAGHKLAVSSVSSHPSSDSGKKAAKTKKRGK